MNTNKTALYCIDGAADCENDVIVTWKMSTDGTRIIDRRQLLAAARELRCTEYDIRSYRDIFVQTKKGSWYNLRTGIRPLSEE